MLRQHRLIALDIFFPGNGRAMRGVANVPDGRIVKDKQVAAPRDAAA